jgi:hypothetical protein
MVASLIVRLGPVWLAVQGPSCDWSAREFRESRLALAPLSYVSTHRRHARPFSMSLAVILR